MNLIVLYECEVLSLSQIHHLYYWSKLHHATTFGRLVVWLLNVLPVGANPFGYADLYIGSLGGGTYSLGIRLYMLSCYIFNLNIVIIFSNSLLLFIHFYLLQKISIIFFILHRSSIFQHLFHRTTNFLFFNIHYHI